MAARPRAGYGDEEQLGATKDAIGVAVPESREERSQGVGRVATPAQAVHGEHVQGGKAQPESSLPHERNEPCSASQGKSPLGRLLGIKREDGGGIGAFSPGEVQVARIVEEHYLLKGRGVQHGLPDKIGESETENPDDPWFPQRIARSNPSGLRCRIGDSMDDEGGQEHQYGEKAVGMGNAEETHR